MSERFVSLQGEGISTGAPAAFLRLGNCNLACSYCDTPYTWDETRFDLKAELSAHAIDDLATWIANEAPGRLIITGGEPLLQHRRLVALLEQVDQKRNRLSASRVFVEVETNATLLGGASFLERVDQFNVSPKLESSGEPEARRIKPEVLGWFASSERAFFKFVVSTPADVSEVERLIERFALQRTRVQLMPEARDVVQLEQRAPLVASWALAAGVRYSGRLHLQLYGGRRGT